jgi:ribosomal protein S18 acetylase RimI-like enzyme
MPVERAGIADVDAVVDLYSDIAELIANGLHTKERTQRDIEKKCVYLFKDKEAPVGAITIEESVHGRIIAIAVHERYRGRGIGGELVKYARKHFQERDIAWMVTDFSTPEVRAFCKKYHLPVEELQGCNGPIYQVLKNTSD